MRDLLTDLVRRTWRPESTVQPRLTSAYEAPMQSTLDDVVDHDATGEPPAAPLPMSARAHVEPTRTTMRRAVHDSTEPTIDMRRATPVERKPVDRSDRPAPATTQASPEVTPRVTPLATPATPRGPASVPAAVVASVTATRIPSSDVSARQAPPRVVSPIQPLVRTDVPSLRRVHADTAREEAGTRERQAPDIRISIGRIEVRASAAERVPARRPSPASASPLTLDEYLASRGRRGSR